MDVHTGIVVDGPLPRTRNTSLAWLPGGDAFYYARRVADEELDAEDLRLHRRVLLHHVGTPPESDVQVFGGEDAPDSYYGLTTSADGGWLAVTAIDGSATCNDVWLAELADPQTPRFTLWADSARTGARVLPRFLPNNALLLITDHEAPCGRICVAAPHDDISAWRTLIPEDPAAPLDDCVVLDGTGSGHSDAQSAWLLLVARTRRSVSELTLHDLADGRLLTQVPLPGAGVVSELRTATPQARQAWLSYCDIVRPGAVHRYDVESGVLACEAETELASGGPDFAIRSERVRYPADDGTDITLLLFDPPEAAEGPRPTLLYGYGSFGVPMRPLYSPMAAAWVRAGGTYAIACVRGGGDEGQQWHDAGRRAHKYRAVRDFNNAAEWLIQHGRTTSGQMAVYGASGGGLLVTAAAVQRPELYAAVVAGAPLCDMVRFERFGLGCTWTDEFGTAARAEELGWLLAYSPYHLVRPGTDYPAFLFTGPVTDLQTGEAHVTKMCAALQSCTSGHRPILMRREPGSSHSVAPAGKDRVLAADILAFAGTHTGLSPFWGPSITARRVSSSAAATSGATGPGSEMC